MEPQLINKRVLKKLLKKAYNQTDEMYVNNKQLHPLINGIKTNWYYILIVILFIIIGIQIYIKINYNKQKKLKEEQEKEKFTQLKKKKKEKFKQVRFVDSPESEYYKMLPRVSNSPNIIPYQY